MNSQKDIMGMIATEAVEAQPQTLVVAKRPLPGFAMGERVIPIHPCLLIAGNITAINPPDANHYLGDYVENRYEITLDIPILKGKVQKVHRYESELERTSLEWEQTPYATVGPK